MFVLWGLAILLMIYVYVHFNEKSRLIDQMFPGPFRIPIIGQNPFNIYPLDKFYKYLLETAKAYNYRPSRIWRLHVPFIIIQDSKTAKIILSKLKFTHKKEIYDALEPWLGQNHFLASGEKWLKYRKFDAPIFNLLEMASDRHLQIFNKNFNTLYEELKNHDGKKAFDVKEYIYTYVLDNTCESILGEEMKTLTSSKSAFADALEYMESMMLIRNVLPILKIDWIFYLTPMGRKEKKSIKIIRDFSGEVLRKKRESLNVRSDHTSSDKNKTTSYNLFHKHMVANVFTDEEIQIEIETSILGGHHTVSSALCFLLYALAEHPQIQEKVHQELEHILGKNDNCPTADQINYMKYTEQFIKETLRYYSIVPFIGRYVKEDVHINEHQYIPKNTSILIIMAAIHRDPTNWPNPDVFDPDRFSEEMIRNRDPYAFIPFSAGPRNCLGYKFAMLEIKMTIAKALRYFKFSLSEDPRDHVKPAINVAITSANGFNIKVQSRKL